VRIVTRTWTLSPMHAAVSVRVHSHVVVVAAVVRRSSHYGRAVSRLLRKSDCLARKHRQTCHAHLPLLEYDR
jgi:hypothetical protein